MKDRLSRKDRDIIEHEFEVADVDLNKMDSNMKENMYKEMEILDRISTDVENEIKAMESKNMQEMNMYGDSTLGGSDQSINQKEDPIGAHNQKIRDLVKDMIQEAQEADPEGRYKNFGERKAFSAYDPYNHTNFFSHLRYEDEIKLRASIVIDEQMRALTDLRKANRRGELNEEDRLTLLQCDTLLNRLAQVKIIDAPVLLKIYNLYKYDITE